MKRIEKQVSGWNSSVKIGDLVTYLDDYKEANITRTRSEASLLGGHTAVVWIEGRVGCVNLARVKPHAST